jgi:sterol desaturase/sphingolipid hydroxylase (fatty acid hydroxylase superfamily)
MSIETLLAGKAVLIAAALVVFFVCERLWPAVDSPLLLRLGRATAKAWRRLARNLGLFSLNLVLSPLVVVPITAWANLHDLGLRPAWWGGWPGLVADVLILDFWIYWWHRANHELGFLWRFHSVHHFDELLDSTSALRFHFGEVFLSALARVPVILVLGMPLASVITFEALVMVAAIFHHSDARLPPKLEAALSRVVITPSIHWVHHHKVRSDTDSNYGTIFSFWDPLFRSRSRTRRWSSMPIGVEGGDEKPLLRLITAPLEHKISGR